MKKFFAVFIAVLMVSVSCISAFAGLLEKGTSEVTGKEITCCEYLDFKAANNVWAKQETDGTWSVVDLRETPADDDFNSIAAYLDPSLYKAHTTDRGLVWSLETDGEVLHVKATSDSTTPGLPFVMDSWMMDILTGSESADVSAAEYIKIRVKNPSTSDQFTIGYINSNTNGGASFLEATITDVAIDSVSGEWKTYIFSVRENNSNTNYQDKLVKDANGIPTSRWTAKLKDLLIFPFGYNVTDGTGAYNGAEMYIDYIVLGSKEYVTNYKSEIEAKEANVTSLTLDTKPTKQAYYVGDQIDLSGMKLTAKYADGTSEALDGSVVDVSYNFNEESSASTVTLKYGEFSQSYTVKVTGIKQIEIATAPETTTYDVKTVKSGFAPKGLTIKVTYNDNATATYGIGSFVLGDVDATKTGAQVIDVNFHGSHTSFTINLINVVEIKVADVEKAIRYGTTLTQDDLGITCVYSDGSEKSLADADINPTVEIECDAKTPGQTKVKVKVSNATYAIECETEATATVEAPQSLKIETIDGAKTVYNVGETFNTSGYKVSYVYGDGTTVIVDAADYKTKYDFGTPGDKSVTFVDNNTDLTATFDVKVEGSTITKRTTTSKVNPPSGETNTTVIIIIVVAVVVVAAAVCVYFFVIKKKKANK